MSKFGKNKDLKIRSFLPHCWKMISPIKNAHFDLRFYKDLNGITKMELGNFGNNWVSKFQVMN